MWRKLALEPRCLRPERSISLSWKCSQFPSHRKSNNTPSPSHRRLSQSHWYMGRRAEAARNTMRILLSTPLSPVQQAVQPLPFVNAAGASPPDGLNQNKLEPKQTPSAYSTTPALVRNTTVPCRTSNSAHTSTEARKRTHAVPATLANASGTTADSFSFCERARRSPVKDNEHVTRTRAQPAGPTAANGTKCPAATTPQQRAPAGSTRFALLQLGPQPRSCSSLLLGGLSPWPRHLLRSLVESLTRS